MTDHRDDVFSVVPHVLTTETFPYESFAFTFRFAWRVAWDGV